MGRATRSTCKCGFSYLGEADRLRRICPYCGLARVKKHTPRHMAGLKQPRSVFVEANDGYDGCWVCRELGLEPGKPTVRDHEHSGDGRARGLLCVYHNRKLGPVYTLRLLRAYVAYLGRHERGNEQQAA